MFWINIFFWALVVVSITIDSKKPNFTYGYKSEGFNDYVESSNFEYALYYIFDAISMKRWDTDKMISTFNRECAKSIHLRDRIFGYLTGPIVKHALIREDRTNSLLNISICIGCFCYNTINTAFTICCFTTIFAHAHYSPLLRYLDTSEQILYYITPLSIFLIVTLFCVTILKLEFGWRVSKYAFITAFLVSFPIAIFSYDWSTAYDDYSYDMEEEYGDDWEEELQDAENENMYRRH